MRPFISYTISLVVLILLLVLVLAFIPTLARTEWGRQQIVAWINHRIPGKVDIRQLDLRWGKGQSIQGIVVNDPQGQVVLSIERFVTQANLWTWLQHPIFSGPIVIENLHATIISDEQGSTNLQTALGLSSTSSHSLFFPSVITLSNVYADVNLISSGRHPFAVNIRGSTTQDTINGFFQVSLSLPGLQATDWNALERGVENYLNAEGAKEAKIHVEALHFPVDLIDRLLALRHPNCNGLFRAFLGPSINFAIDEERHEKEGLFSLTLSSEWVRGQLKGKIAEENVFHLTEPALFDFQLNPTFANPFLLHHRLELLSASNLHLMVSNLSFPCDFFHEKTSVDPCLLAFRAEYKLPKTEINFHSVGRVSIDDLHGVLDAPACDPLLKAQGICRCTRGSESFDLILNSTMDKPVHYSYLVKQLRQHLRASLKISHLPLNLIQSPYARWIDLIGSHIDGEVNVGAIEHGEWEVVVAFNSAAILLKEAKFRIGQEIILQSPAQFEWTGSPSCLQFLMQTKALDFDQTCRFLLVVNQFRMPLHYPQHANYQLALRVPHVRFPHLLPWGILDVQNVVLEIGAESLTKFDSSMTGQVALHHLNGLDSPLMQDSLRFRHTSNWQIGQSGTCEMCRGKFHLENAIANLEMEGRLNADREFELIRPAKAHYFLTPCALQTLGLSFSTECPQLQREALLHLTINPSVFSLRKSTLFPLNVQGTLSIDRIALQDSSGDLPVLEKIVIPWAIDSDKNNFSAAVKGIAYSKAHSVPSQLAGYFQIWPQIDEDKDLKLEMGINFAAIPSSVLSMAFKNQKKEDWKLILGPVIDLNFKMFYDPSKKESGYADIQLDSAQCHIKGRFKLEGATATLFDLAKPATVRFTVTPASYRRLKTLLAMQNGSDIVAPFTLSSNLLQCTIPLHKEWLYRTSFDATLSTTDVDWEKGNLPHIAFEGRFMRRQARDKILFSGCTFSSNSLIGQGEVSMVLPEDAVNWREIGIKAKIEGQKILAPLLLNLELLDTAQSRKWSAFFGDPFEVSMSCDLQRFSGPLHVLVKGRNGSFSLEGELQEGILTLHNPLQISSHLTTSLIDSFFSGDLLHSAIGEENPLTCRIDSDGFSCPLVPFSLEDLQIKKGTIELGKIVFHNEGEISSLLPFLKPLSGTNVLIWFTPLLFQIEKGRLTFKRWDMLVEKAYRMAGWGHWDLVHRQGDFVIGISAQTLEKTLGIKGLDKNYLLQIPLKVTDGKAEINRKKAVAQIAFLVAQTQTGSSGKLFGRLFDSTLLNQPVPPSPTQLFPWGDDNSLTDAVPPSTSEEISSPKKKHKRRYSHSY